MLLCWQKGWCVVFFASEVEIPTEGNPEDYILLSVSIFGVQVMGVLLLQHKKKPGYVCLGMKEAPGVPYDLTGLAVLSNMWNDIQYHPYSQEIQR